MSEKKLAECRRKIRQNGKKGKIESYDEDGRKSSLLLLPLDQPKPTKPTAKLNPLSLFPFFLFISYLFLSATADSLHLFSLPLFSSFVVILPVPLVTVLLLPSLVTSLQDTATSASRRSFLLQK